jgi:hypothetical protein
MLAVDVRHMMAAALSRVDFQSDLEYSLLHNNSMSRGTTLGSSLSRSSRAAAVSALSVSQQHPFLLPWLPREYCLLERSFRWSMAKTYSRLVQVLGKKRYIRQDFSSASFTAVLSSYHHRCPGDQLSNPSIARRAAAP